jgi:Uma2 family endonuclease
LLNRTLVAIERRDMVTSHPPRRYPRMVSFRPTHPVTDAELERLSQTNPGIRFERGATGELIVSPTGTIGGRGESDLTFQLESWARRNGQGFVTSSSAGFALPDGSVLAPDGAWTSYKRWNTLSNKERKGYAHIAPNVVFELLSPSDSLADARKKASAYLMNGTRLVVLLDPHSRCVELHRAGNESTLHAPSDAIALDPEMPEFRLDAAAIFKRLED